MYEQSTIVKERKDEDEEKEEIPSPFTEASTTLTSVWGCRPLQDNGSTKTIWRN